MKMQVSLSIGYAGAVRRDELEIDQEEWEECETEEEREELCETYWQEWADNYIDGGWCLED